MKKNILPYSVLSILILLFCSCSKNDTEDNCILPKFEVPIIQPSGSEDYLNLNSEIIFNQDSLYSFHIKIPGENLAFLDADPKKEEYTEAMLIFQKDTISPIGIRYKGSNQSWNGFLSEGNTGSKSSTKLSTKIKINWLNKGTTFYGLKKLQFHSLNNDPSLMKERLGYWLYGNFGVKSPRCVHAKLYINDEFIGLYALTEQIDGKFANLNFQNDGNILKDIWPIQPDRKATIQSLMIQSLKTNEEISDISNFADFAYDIENTNSMNMKTLIERWFDVESLIRNMVVGFSIGHTDEAAFYWWCGEGDCVNGNIYWFSDDINQKVHLIPWDLDNLEFKAIDSTIYFKNNSCMTGDTIPFYDESINFLVYNDKLQCGFMEFQDVYEDRMSIFKNTLFNDQTIDPLLIKWKSQIENDVLRASDIYDDAPSITTWENEIQKLKNW
jgi:spore coat protein CotH